MEMISQRRDVPLMGVIPTEHTRDRDLVETPFLARDGHQLVLVTVVLTNTAVVMDLPDGEKRLVRIGDLLVDPSEVVILSPASVPPPRRWGRGTRRAS